MIEFFVDPMLRAPTLSSMLMCLSSSLIGVLVFLRKNSLLSETLSHATYPGVALALIIGTFFSWEEIGSFSILTGAFFTAICGFLFLRFLQKKGKLKEDSALTFVLASFFGIGVTLASYVQGTLPRQWQKVHGYLYGQIATMTDEHIFLYGILTVFVITILFLFYKEITVFLFDHNFALVSRIGLRKAEILFLFLSVIAVVIGIRTVGLVLISAMLIAPSIFARAFTDNLKILFCLAASMGVLTAFLGNYFSYHLSLSYNTSFPIGAVIVLIASFLSLMALLFAPKRGLILRYFRIKHFQWATLEENILKMMWRSEKKEYTYRELISFSGVSSFTLFFVICQLKSKKEIEHTRKGYSLTFEGNKRGKKIVRLHRLWEVYLVDYLGMNVRKVHKSAEEIEHILTPDLEKALIELLKDPKLDPHDQPIPPSEGVSLYVS